MASTAATAQSYNDLNVLGEVLQVGATKNTGQFITAIGGINSPRRVDSSVQFPMSATYSLDAGAQGNISENTSLTAGTPNFYAKTLEYNATQINKYEFVVSNRRESSNQQLNTTSLSIGGRAPDVSEFDRAAMNAMEQLAADWEWSALQGVFQDRSAVTTAEGMRGINTGISTNGTNATSAALSRDLINTELTNMVDNGADMRDMAFVCRATYVTQLSSIYGFQPQARDIGGLGLKQIMTDFGMFNVIWTNNAPANTLMLVDMSYCAPVVQPNLGQDILMREYVDGGSGRKGYIEGFISIDYGSESKHGNIINLA